jgi:hypothetical protein
LANTSEQIRLMISTRMERNGASVEGARAEFGQFAAGRIDSERMSRLLTQVEPRKLEHGDLVVRAFDTCNELLARRESLFSVTVDPGEDLHAAVGGALAEIGRAFAATRVVDLVSQGAYRESEHGGLLDAHPYRDWTRVERSVARCLVVSVAGRDLRVGGLTDFVDHTSKLVLVVQGEAPPAALVRLISPGVLVQQTADVGELEWVAGFDGPGVVALLSDSAAHFRHDPSAGPRLADRLVITNLPDRKPRRLGVSSGFQQREDLAQLEALAASAEAASDAPAAEAEAAPDDRCPAPAATDDASKLSAWLLRQADLSGPQ